VKIIKTMRKLLRPSFEAISVCENKRDYLKLLFSLLFIVLSTVLLSAQTVSGRIFRDYNANGAFDSTIIEPIVRENGQAGVRVSAYDRNNTLLASSISAFYGHYTLSVGTTDSLRIEFDSIPSVDFPSPVGSSNKSSVQFVVGGATGINFGINYPAHYSQADPDMLTSCYVNGAVSASGVNDVVVKWQYSDSLTDVTHKTVVATKQQVGSTWGMAYARSTKHAYTASFVKRHCGLPDFNADSLGDVSNIYVIDFNPSVPTTSTWLNLTTLGLNFGTIGTDFSRGLRNTLTPSRDPTTVAVIGKIGIGGIDLSDDDSTLFVMNLFERKIHAIRTADKTLLYSATIPDPVCTGGSYRPFALKYYKGKVYIGVVCDAATSGDSTHLSATVYSFDGTTFSTVLQFPLNYGRQLYFRNTANWSWLSWRDVFDGGRQAFSSTIPVDMQPLFADIEFDPNGDGMILALVDRYGHIGGSRNYDDDSNTTFTVLSPGDILYAQKTGINTWQIETNGDKDGAAGPYVPRTDQNTLLIDRRAGATEFFRDDMISASGTNSVNHREVLTGGLAVMALNNRVDFITLDPLDVTATGGTRRLNCYDGRYANAFQIYFTGNTTTTFSKANGLGDIEIMAQEPPIEIGNRVWLDANSNGIQDANERPIQGIVIELLDSLTQTVRARATTNARGEYYFSSANQTNPADSSAKYNLAILKHTAYQLRILNVDNTGYIPLGLNHLALTTAATGTNKQIDSDAILRGSNAVIDVRTSGAGQNSHIYDFGFQYYIQSCPPKICLPAVVTRQ
jgi:hypothetical protein